MPSIIAGPIVRHCDKSQLNFWLVTTTPCDFMCSLYNKSEHKNKNVNIEESPPFFNVTLIAPKNTISNLSSHGLNNNAANNQSKTQSELQQIQVGSKAYINLITLRDHNSFPENTLIEYDICARFTPNNTKNVTEINESVTQLAKLLYKNEYRPSLVIKPVIQKMLHGSCRKPHFDSDDALIQVDELLATTDFSAKERPSMLMMSGDQVYVDDIAGPTLSAIHQVIELLGLFDESWEEQDVTSNKKSDQKTTQSQQLFQHEHCYYQREKILPTYITNSLIFGEKVHPVFTTVHFHNHLITLSEVLAMYFLTWSPELWEQVAIDKPPSNMSAEFTHKYQQEYKTTKAFAKGLYSVRRAMAHIPVYMIFDDHDITDDWNLTRGWEEAAYTNLFSKQIIGNALFAYWLCQGWGNAPDKFQPLVTDTELLFTTANTHDELNKNIHTNNEQRLALINKLFDWEAWNYNLATTPKMVILDTRTQRWRSESRANKPSPRMDWETLSDFQQALIKEPSVIVVSAAPIYGVKLIETVQRMFTFFGKPLAVDAENWMAHSGTANVILNIFRNPKTPPQFIILSGDVHYSFVYEVSHRFRKSSAKILQVTCSGIKNKFPDKLLTTLEKLNKILYATYSPLNMFTKRRRMKIRVRKPNTDIDQHLYNGSGIGVLILNKNEDVTIEIITEIITSTGKTIRFNKYDVGDEND